MGLAVKVDEDLPARVADLLRSAGHQAETVVGQGMGGAKDAALWQAVQVEGRFLVRADKGFGDIRLYPPGTHGGVLLLRPDEDGVEPLVDLLRRVLEGKGFEPRSPFLIHGPLSIVQTMQVNVGNNVPHYACSRGEGAEISARCCQYSKCGDVRAS